MKAVVDVAPAPRVVIARGAQSLAHRIALAGRHRAVHWAVVSGPEPKALASHVETYDMPTSSEDLPRP